MAPSDYYPLSSLTPNEADAPVQHDGNFQYEPNHLTPAVYSTIPGVPSHSIPRKPLQSSETTSQPRPLKSARPWYTLLTQGVLDIVLCIAPLTFFGLAWCALSLSGKEVSRWGTSVQEWSLIAPTIFPIVFAAVVGRSTDATASHLLERGISLITLEQLVRSNSISSAVTTQIGLHRMTLLGAGLMMLWALSPAGGQASLRLLSITTRDLNSTANVAYMNNAEQSSMLFDDLQTNFVYGQVDSIYIASLLGTPSIKQNGQDMWNNVKVPILAKLNSSSADEDGWLPIPKDNVTYSSLLGYPIAGVPTSGSSSFPFNTYYYQIQCQKLWHVQFPNSTNGTIPDWYTPLGLSDFNGETNVTTVWEPASQSYATTYSSFFISRYMPNMTGPVDPMTTRLNSIFLGSQYGLGAYIEETGVSLANCTIEPIFVECVVDCTGNKCGVAKMRPGQPYNSSSFLWNTDLMSTGNTEYFDMFSQALAVAIPGTYYEGIQSTPTEVYMSGNEFFPFATTPAGTSGGQVVLYKVPIDDLAQRFSTVVNTYWQASMAPGKFWTGQFSTAPMEDILCVVNNCTANSTGTVYDSIFPMAVRADISHTVHIYNCHIWWLVLLVVASTLLFLVGLIGAVLRWRTLAPDILGYASTLVRDNPYVPAGITSSATDGFQTTRDLADMKIWLADVRPDDKYGHVAVTAAHAGQDKRAVGLSRGRLYL